MTQAPKPENQLPFNKKIGLSFAIMIIIMLLVGGISVIALRSVIKSKDQVLDVNAKLLIGIKKVELANEYKIALGRAYIITRDRTELPGIDRARESFLSEMEAVRQSLTDPEARQILETVRAAEIVHQASLEKSLDRESEKKSIEWYAKYFREVLKPQRDTVVTALRQLSEHQERALENAKQESSRDASQAAAWVLCLSVGFTLLAAILGWVLSKNLTRQVASAVQHIQSSSTELQAAANEQSLGSKEQGTAVTEIATTIKELLATSRQISESAQRVAQIAEGTAIAARKGDITVQRGQEAISTIKRQTDLIVNQVIELGKRSQQIESVVDIITELADQTNILAINATIEAVSAGESGKRFSVVADEIRKLADRVGLSTKDIKLLNEEIRASMNSTVMLTESGSKAVESGTIQFGEVAASFQDIVGSVTTTTQAAKEIELSTKQQTTAVEQVSSAIANVAQAVHEMEASSTQTLQTSKQLSKLSKELASLVQSQADAGV